MRRKIKNVIMLLSFLLLVVTIVERQTIQIEAGTKDGTYYFSSCYATKFQVKNNKLTLKVSKSDDSGITKKNDDNYKKYKLTLKVSKNCKYILEEYYRMTGESSRRRGSYSDVQESVAFDRAYYKSYGVCNTVGLSRIVVKNNRVVKMVHFQM